MPWDNLNLGAESCCACPTRVCVNARCGTGGVSGATVTIREAAVEPHTGAVLGSGTTNSAGGFCATIENEGNVDIQIEKDGYHPVELMDEPVPCATGRTFAVDLCPTTITLWLSATSCNNGVCRIPGTLIEIAGDLTGELTTTGVFLIGDAITLDTPDPAGGDCTLSVTFTATPPEGYGMEPATIERELLACSPDWTRIIGLKLMPSPGTTGARALETFWDAPFVSPMGCCSGHYLSDTVNYSDDYGSCTLTYGLTGYGAGYSGEYLRHSPFTVKKVAQPYGDPKCECSQPGEVRIEVILTFGGDSCPGVVPTWKLYHLFPASPCGPSVLQMVSDLTCFSVPRFAYGEMPHACDGTAFNVVIPFSNSENIEDTSGTATITGAAV